MKKVCFMLLMMVLGMGSSKVWGINIAWVNNWSSTPSSGSEFYIYNNTESAFLRAGQNSSNAVTDKSNASCWTFNSNTTLGCKVGNTTYYIQFKTSEAVTNATSTGLGYYEAKFNYSGGAFQILHRVSGAQRYYMYISNKVLKDEYVANAFKSDASVGHYDWYLVNKNQYNNHLAIEAYDPENSKVDGVYSTSNLPNTLYNKVKDYVNPTTGYLNYSSWLSTTDKSSSINTATQKIKDWFNGYDVAAVSTAYLSALETLDGYENGDIVTCTNISTVKTALEAATTVAAIDAAMALVQKKLTLIPTKPTYPNDTYASITLSRTLKAGYNSLALPFGTTVATLTGRSNAGDWVAQLQTVTYNAQDGYTLYFQKGDGTIAANQPYVLHLADGAANITNPTFSGQAVSAPSAQTVTPSSGYDGQDDINSSYEDWTMRSNFTKGFSMAGKYGIVNSAGGLMLGGEGSTLNAFSAYIQPPTGAAGIRVQSAYIDWDGTIDYVPGLPGEASDFEDSAVYDLSGRRISHPVRGLNIIRRPDGTVRKVMAR